MSQIPLDCSMYFDRDCDDYPVFLLELTHPDYEGLLRLCSSKVQRIGEWEDGTPQYGVMSTLGGTELNTYVFVPMALTPPSQEEDGAPTASLTVFRTNELTVLLRTFRTRIFVRMYQVSAKEPNLVRADYPGFSLSHVEIGGATVDGTMGIDMQETEPFPGPSYSKKYFPGVHS